MISFTRLDVDFHLQIAAASHNAIMVYLVESIREALRNTITAGLESRGAALNIETIQATHEALYRMLVAGDVQGAQISMVHHFDEAIAALTNPQS